MKIDTDPTVTAVVVSYNPDHDRLRSLLDSILPQVARVVIADNGSGPETVEFLRGLQRVLDFDLIEFGENRGIAAAHNAGIRHAAALQHAYILLLDHDSVLAPDCVPQLLKAHRSLTDAGVQLAAVGPRYLDETSGATAPFLRYTRWNFSKHYPTDAVDVIEVSVLISSGSLISAQVLEQVGLMDEALFIDCVDWDWCFRAASLGYRLFGVAAASMRHSLGDSGIRILKRKIPLHSPMRHYYAYRNNVLLCKRDTVPLSWKLHGFVRLGVRFAIYMMLSPHRLQRCRYIFRGVVDGLRNRSGRI